MSSQARKQKQVAEVIRWGYWHLVERSLVHFHKFSETESKEACQKFAQNFAEIPHIDPFNLSCDLAHATVHFENVRKEFETLEKATQKQINKQINVLHPDFEGVVLVGSPKVREVSIRRRPKNRRKQRRPQKVSKTRAHA
jgi:hypothetical protein